MARSMVLAAGFVVLFGNSVWAKTNSPVGRKVENFTLRDYRGKTYSLSDFRKSRLVVIAVLGTECPLARLYAPRLAHLAEKYQKQNVAFIGIDANSQDSITEIAAYARHYSVTFPLLKDVGNRVVDRLGAVRTPEVFVLDQKRIVRYWGRVDDQYGVGYVRRKPTRKDLELALNQLLAGKAVADASHPAVGCFIGRIRKPQANSTVTYSNQIARILQQRCVECHRKGDIAPFTLTKYDEVAGWAEAIAENVRINRMPPWHADPKFGRFRNDRHMPESEKQLIYKWVAEGAPRGDLRQLPPPQKYVTGWQLPQKPDAVFYARSEPEKVPAEGTVRYKYYVVDPGFKEGKWVKMAEVLPGNRQVVHHILVFVLPPGRQDTRRLVTGGFLVGYVPGLRAVPLPKGMAKWIPPGSKLLFQLHYTPIGSVQHDRSKVGLVYADPAEIKHRVVTTRAINTRFKIPAGNDNYRVEATSPSLPKHSQLLSFLPHMHLRGKAFRYEVVFPNGKTRTMLNVPAYDFNWQTVYRLEKPLLLPEGTRLHCVAHFDNSDNNLNNPDPTIPIRWGDQTWDEMMIGYFDIAVPVDPVTFAKAEAARAAKAPKIDWKRKARKVVKRFDKNGDGRISRDEIPDRLARVFKRMDLNSDEVVTVEELVRVIKKLRP